MKLNQILVPFLLCCLLLSGQASNLRDYRNLQMADGESQRPGYLTEYWCGLGPCNDSTQNDINQDATHVILAFAGVTEVGQIEVDGEMPTQLIQDWRNNGIDVLISVGGEDFDWQVVFDHIQQFAQSIEEFLTRYQLQGIDLNIRNYQYPVLNFEELFRNTRESLTQQEILMVTIDSVAVYPGQSFPNESPIQGIVQDGESKHNFIANLYAQNNEIFDLVQIRLYRAEYDGTQPSDSEIVLAVVEGWMNENNNNQISQFQGVPAEKIIISVLASEDAYDPEIDNYYLESSDLNDGLLTLIENGHFIKGLNIFNSHYDEQNNQEISEVGVAHFVTLEETSSEMPPEAPEGEEQMPEGEQQPPMPGDGESQRPGVLTIYYCGFGECDESDSNDVNPEATHVLLAFMPVNDQGQIEPDREIPTDLLEEWRSNNQQILVSIGGKDFDWQVVLDNQEAFIQSLTSFLQENQLDGVDFNYRSYEQDPEEIRMLLEDVKSQLSQDQVLLLTIDSVAVIPEGQVPEESDLPDLNPFDEEISRYNYLVPIFTQSQDTIDLVQVAIYDHRYGDYTPDQQEIILAIAEGWTNKNNNNPDSQFQGVPAERIVLSVLASEEAWESENVDQYYMEQNDLNEGLLTLIENRIFIGGLNVFNSHYDEENGYEISDVGAAQFVTLEETVEMPEGEEQMPEGEEQSPADGESQRPGVLTVYYCGFGLCDDSESNDVNPEATHVILAFMPVNEQGQIEPDREIPTDLLDEWRSNNQQILVSFGGEDYDWDNIISNPNEFISSLQQFIVEYELDGVDLFFRTVQHSEEEILRLIENIKSQLSQQQILIVTMNSRAIYTEQVDEDNESSEDDGESIINFLAPLYSQNTTAVDFYQIAVYNNPFEGTQPGEPDILVNIVETWMNLQQNNPNTEFQGIPPEKLIISVLSSEEAHDSEADDYFLDQDSLNEGLLGLIENGIFVAGLNVFNSHYDEQNAYEISDVGVRQFITLQETTDDFDGVIEMPEGEEQMPEGEQDGESQMPGYVTIYYCAFGSCTDTELPTNDVNPDATHVILAYLSVSEEGEVSISEEVPQDLIDEWRGNGQDLVVSVGGDDLDWSRVFDNQDEFVESLMSYLQEQDFDGVDIDLTDYSYQPQQVLSLLEAIKQELSSDQILILTVDSLAVLSQTNRSVPSLTDTPRDPTNYLVPIYNENPDAFDLVQVKSEAYSYLSLYPGASQYLVQGAEGWLNKNNNHPSSEFNGIPQQKILLSLLARTNTLQDEIQPYYSGVENLKDALLTLVENDIFLKGINVQDSYEDQNHNYQVSDLAVRQFVTREVTTADKSSSPLDSVINKPLLFTAMALLIALLV